MDTKDLLNYLEYTDSPYFLTGSRLYSHPAFSHVFHQAQKKCGLQGVYILSGGSKLGAIEDYIIPTVFVCRVNCEEDAVLLHRTVWNQNTVPFLLVESPKCFRLYPGFKYKPDRSLEKEQEIIRVTKDANLVLNNFAELKASAINSGAVWEKFGEYTTQESRVDAKLLNDLRNLSKWLRKQNLEKHIAHSLIGKYLFLNYLSDRGILSDRKFAEWGIDKHCLFGRNAKFSTFRDVVFYLDEWLNGTIFPIPDEGLSAINERHVQKVAATFSGDDPKSGQMHLNFRAYEFQHIPIETLSIVYQQFLHAEGKGRNQGAYYTPIHLVNFILDSIESRRPLLKGMKVLDPACGSGAFLVQCYRRLIEKEINNNLTRKLSPYLLREILTSHIYGIDIDEDACGVSELSLTMTLLDYVDPPDLKDPKNKDFRLPSLRNKNIFFINGGFFASDENWSLRKPLDGFDWIIGNPPWKRINPKKPDAGDNEALSWISANRTKYPISNNQIAEAFAWKIIQEISEKGVVGLIMPAGTLFKANAKAFRKKFFSTVNAWCIVNFANLRHQLFQGAVNPAAVFFYRFNNLCNRKDQSILTYAPFAVNQISRYKTKGIRGRKIWAITVSGDELKEISIGDAATGDNIPWKIAMWGSHRDIYLINSLSLRFPSFLNFLSSHNLQIHEGIQLRSKDSKEKVDRLLEVQGKKELNISALTKYEGIFAVPEEALNVIPSDRAWVRKGRGQVPLQVCRPPHVIIHAARKFAIFSDEFIVIPPRQLGIGGKKKDEKILKAIALYLNSDFVAYHQFIFSTFWGVERDRPDKGDLEKLPTPLDFLSNEKLSEWANLYDELAMVSKRNFTGRNSTLFNEPTDNSFLKNELNDLVYSLLGVNVSERWQVEDLLFVRKELNEGRLATIATRSANKSDVKEYAEALKSELDEFMGLKNKHRITAFIADTSILIKIENLKDGTAGPAQINFITDQKARSEFQDLERNLLKDAGQWIYFKRNLKVYNGRTTYFLKPRQKLSWLRSQALLDADEFIAEKLRNCGDYIVR